jgi:hypothetical protein
MILEYIHYLCRELFDTMEKRSKQKQFAHFYIVTHLYFPFG